MFPEGNIMRILLVDDHSMIRAGIKHLIVKMQKTAEIFEATNAKEGLQIAIQEDLDLIFLDLKLPQEPGGISNGEVGLNLLKALCEMEKSVPVIVMTGEFLTKESVERILRAGAVSFVPKTSSSEMMLEAIQRALNGGVWLPPEGPGETGDFVSSNIDSLLRNSPQPITATDLGVTEREFDVLRLAMQGNAPWKVARILDINPANTRRYLSKLYSRFGVIDLYGLQCHFAKTGQLLGIISSASRTQDKKPMPTIES